jgi:Sigma-70 region 2
LLRLVTLSTGDHDLAETIVQDCFLKAYRARESFRGDCSVSTWLFTIALNVTRDYQRLQKPHFWKSASLTDVKLDRRKIFVHKPGTVAGNPPVGRRASRPRAIGIEVSVPETTARFHHAFHR